MRRVTHSAKIIKLLTLGFRLIINYIYCYRYKKFLVDFYLSVQSSSSREVILKNRHTLMKQIGLDFGEDFEKELDKKYTAKIEAPLYLPKRKKPHVLELVDLSKSNRLIAQIRNSGIEEKEKDFLIEAAKRHSVFNYGKIADYYAHSNKEIQALMERSALVIIDFDKAIELGYVKLSEGITNQYLNELEDEA